VISFTLERVSHEAFDLALDAPRFVLWRHGAEVRISLDERHAGRVRRALAYRGVRATIAQGAVPAPPGLRRSVGTDLLPARLRPEDLDVLDVRVLTIGDATARVLRRPIRSWPLGARRRARCAALLRRGELLLEIRRTAWCTRATLRAHRRTLRPVLFDAAATPRVLRVYASDRALTRWIEG
jgi:hypothetical protein